MNVIVDTYVWTRFLRRHRERSDLLCAEVKLTSHSKAPTN